MIDALVQGKLFGSPRQSTGKAGNLYVTARAKVWTNNGDLLMCDVVAFEDSVQTALLALTDGDNVALSGHLVPKVVQTPSGEYRPGMNMVAHGLLSTYQVRRKRHALEE